MPMVSIPLSLTIFRVRVSPILPLSAEWLLIRDSMSIPLYLIASTKLSGELNWGYPEYSPSDNVVSKLARAISVLSKMLFILEKLFVNYRYIIHKHLLFNKVFFSYSIALFIG